MKKLILLLSFFAISINAFAVPQYCTCTEGGSGYYIAWEYYVPAGTSCFYGYTSGNFYNFGQGALFIEGEYYGTFWYGAAFGNNIYTYISCGYV